MILHAFILLIILLTLSVSVYNFFTAPRLETLRGGDIASPKVSVLIPARNEEKNIGGCLDRVFSLNYGNIEVIVYDDMSEDGTSRVLERYGSAGGRLKVIRGRPKPEGWTGKSWACHNLHAASSGDLLLFVDADVMLSPSCLDGAAPGAMEKGVSLISCFPRQRMRTPGEWLIVPLMNWILLSLLPLKLVYSSGEPSLAAANGQFMLFKRTEYESLGGHEAVKDRLVEDVAFANLIKKAGGRVMTCVTRGEVSCRMYAGLKESVLGFTKNFFPGFGMPIPVFAVFVAALFTAFFAPFILVFTRPWYILDIALICAARALISYASGQNIPLNIVLHPFQMAGMAAVGVSSAAAYATGNIRWKGRKV